MLVAAAASAASLGNGFAYDDVPIVLENARVHELGQLPTLLRSPYWPDDASGLLWRPVSTVAFAVQWALGSGSPQLFHAVNVLLYLACTVALHALARRVLTPARALASAVLFAALPVHTEVTGNIVGQSELWCALWLALAAVLFLDRTPGDRRQLSLVAICGGLAALSKEQGFTAPAVLLALDLARRGMLRDWRAAARDLIPTVLTLAALLAARTLILEGAGGGPPIPALAGLGPLDRAVAMLGLVPRILQVLVAPVRLLADYNPGDVQLAASMGPAAWRGLLLIGAVLLPMLLADQRRRSMLLLAGAGAAFLPVANLLFATGVVFAERHLFLPSMLLVMIPCAIWPAGGPEVRRVATGLVAIAAVLGVIRSAIRLPDWKDSPTLFAATVRDAPLNYRGLLLLSTVQTGPEQFAASEALLTRALAQFDRDARVWDDLGQLVRRRAGCEAALPYFLRAVELQPGRDIARSRLQACLKERQTGRR